MKFTQSGIVIVDKPESISSSGVVQRLKRASGAKKVGHTGTLDPFATGLMICGINKGTRLSRFFLHERKTYRADLTLGVSTDTQDVTGTPVETWDTLAGGIDPMTLEQDRIRQVLESFKGPQKQVPPIYSALKHNGVPLYKHARRGKPVEKPPRDIEIHAIEGIEIALPVIRFTVSCSAGTYIRTLSSDIGKALGCGAHLSALRRTETCGFSIDHAVPMAELEEMARAGNLEERLVPMADAVAHLPAHTADEALSGKIRHGNPITDSDGILPETYGFIRIVGEDGTLLAIVEHKKEADGYDYCCVFNN